MSKPNVTFAAGDELDASNMNSNFTEIWTQFVDAYKRLFNMYGDGSDGTADFDGASTPAGSTKSGSDYTLTRDVYYTNMTMATGTTLDPAGYRIFGTGTLTMNGTSKIKRNGPNGGNGSNATNNSGANGGVGVAMADGYLIGFPAENGGNGGSEAVNVGQAGGSKTGTPISNSIGGNGVAGGAGGGGTQGNGTGPSSGGSSTGGTATLALVKFILGWLMREMLDITATGATI